MKEKLRVEKETREKAEQELAARKVEEAATAKERAAAAAATERARWKVDEEVRKASECALCGGGGGRDVGCGSSHTSIARSLHAPQLHNAQCALCCLR
jgi:hypothetical protein